MKRWILMMVLAALLGPLSAWAVTPEQQEKIEQLKQVVLTHFRNSEWTEAIPLLEEILLINPKDTAASRYLVIANRKVVEPYCELAAAAYLAEDYAEALKHWETILKVNPDDRRVFNLMEDTIRMLNERTLKFLYTNADKLFREGRYELAAAEWEKVLVIAPNEARARELLEITQRIIVDRKVKGFYEKAEEHIRNEEYGLAINALTEVLEVDKTQERAQQMIATLYKKMLDSMYVKAEEFYRQGFYMSARDQYYRIMAANPEDDKVKGIIDRLNGLINVSPKLDAAGEVPDILRRGLMHEISPDGNPEVAIVAAQYAVQVEPENQTFQRILDHLQKTHLSTLQTMERLQRDMNVIDQYLFVALNNIYEGRYDLAVRKCMIVLELQPDNVLALKRLGSAYFALGRKEKARETWEEALKYAPRDAELPGFIKQAR